MPTLAESLAEFAARPGINTVPDAAADTIRNGFLDLSAVLLAGQTEPVVRIFREHERHEAAAREEASVLFGAERFSAESAALINGIAGHALSYDDVAFVSHPSAVLVPAILAEGERLGVSGRQAMLAYLVGYEVWGELGTRDPDPCHAKGWHPTSAYGPVAAAAAVGYLNGLDASVIRNALGIAASEGGGVVANFGTMTKPFHAGHSAAAGVRAVRLAALGMTSSPDALDSKEGLLAAISPAGRVDLGRPADRLGRELRILKTGLSFKKYPNCYSSHRVLDALVDIVEANNLTPEKVAAVEATIGGKQALLLKNHEPQTVTAAKYSLEFAAASILISRNLGLAELNLDFINRPDVQETMKKVSFGTIDTVCSIEPAFSHADRVTVRLKDGTVYDSGEIEFARGHATRPLQPADIRRKFMDCCKAGGYGPAEALYANLASLETIGNVRDIVPTVARAVPGSKSTSDRAGAIH